MLWYVHLTDYDDIHNSNECLLECFEIVNGDLTPNLSNETSRFNKYYSTLMECVNGTYINDTTLCKTCMDNYLDLNNYYISISNENEKIGVCMDIVDLVSSFILVLYNYILFSIVKPLADTFDKWGV